MLMVEEEPSQRCPVDEHGICERELDEAVIWERQRHGNRGMVLVREDMGDVDNPQLRAHGAQRVWLGDHLSHNHKQLVTDQSLVAYELFFMSNSTVNN